MAKRSYSKKASLWPVTLQCCPMKKTHGLILTILVSTASRDQYYQNQYVGLFYWATLYIGMRYCKSKEFLNFPNFDVIVWRQIFHIIKCCTFRKLRVLLEEYAYVKRSNNFFYAPRTSSRAPLFVQEDQASINILFLLAVPPRRIQPQRKQEAQNKHVQGTFSGLVGRKRSC